MAQLNASISRSRKNFREALKTGYRDTNAFNKAGEAFGIFAEAIKEALADGSLQAGTQVKKLLPPGTATFIRKIEDYFRDEMHRVFKEEYLEDLKDLKGISRHQTYRLDEFASLRQDLQDANELVKILGFTLSVTVNPIVDHESLLEEYPELR